MNIKIKREEIETMQTYYQVSRLQDHREAIERRKRVRGLAEAFLALIVSLIVCAVLLYAFLK